MSRACVILPIHTLIELDVAASNSDQLHSHFSLAQAFLNICFDIFILSLCCRISLAGDPVDGLGWYQWTVWMTLISVGICGILYTGSVVSDVLHT